MAMPTHQEPVFGLSNIYLEQVLKMQDANGAIGIRGGSIHSEEDLNLKLLH